MSWEVEQFRKVYAALVEHAPPAPELDQLGDAKVSALKSGAEWPGWLTAAVAVVVVVSAVALPLVLLAPAEEDTGGVASEPWLQRVTADGREVTAWLSETPGEFIIDIGGARLVGSTTSTGVAPYGDAAVEVVSQHLTVTGAAAVTHQQQGWVVLTGRVSPEVHRLLVSVADDQQPAERIAPIDATAVAALPVEGLDPTDPPVLRVEAVDPQGESLATVFVRPFPLGDPRCGNVTEVARPREGETESPTLGATRDRPVTVLPLRPACPTDRTR